MSRRLAGLLAAAALIVASLVWWTSDEREIRSRLEAAVEATEKSGPESELAALAAAREVADLFAPGFVAIAEPLDARAADRHRLIALLRRYRSRAATITIDLQAVEIEVRDDGTATSSFVAAVTMDLGDRRGRESYRMRLDWVEEEEWSIHEARLLEVIDRSEGGPLLGRTRSPRSPTPEA